ncbi:type II secretion system GspH family protein [Deinococcus sp. HMF7604]|uniref:type II secretion system protein n=1 Tax=Deinococcus betulae TaxID=2873312 RepID=UPI001CCAB2F1|nr:type II secretion system protein [Deinococcus betulae]MBZ9753430.1 type II secretion system GspH family protein [Deinococcus betulae]
MFYQEQGFTLIELLIVISIIGLLIAVLVPTILGAQSRAYDASALGCANEIKSKQAMYLIDQNVYAKVGDLKNIYAIACNDGVTISQISSPSATSYAIEVKHVNGTKTYIIRNVGLSSS